jgi:hypothetical protein
VKGKKGDETTRAPASYDGTRRSSRGRRCGPARQWFLWVRGRAPPGGRAPRVAGRFCFLAFYFFYQSCLVAWGWGSEPGSLSPAVWPKPLPNVAGVAIKTRNARFVGDICMKPEMIAIVFSTNNPPVSAKQSFEPTCRHDTLAASVHMAARATDPTSNDEK